MNAAARNVLLAVTVGALFQFAPVYGRPAAPEGEDVQPPPPQGPIPMGGPAQSFCAPNEYQFWGSHEWGCKGLIPITRGACICNEGLFRRETDNACVTKDGCSNCPVNEMQFFGVSEEGCLGNVPIHPGDCICKNGFFRRESDRACVTSCSRSIEINVACRDIPTANLLCNNYCQSVRNVWYCNPMIPDKAQSITCTCT